MKVGDSGVDKISSSSSFQNVLSLGRYSPISSKVFGCHKLAWVSRGIVSEDELSPGVTP